MGRVWEVGAGMAITETLVAVGGVKGKVEGWDWVQ